MDTSISRPLGLFRGPAAYSPHTPWRPLAALAVSAAIVLAGAVAAAFVLPTTLADIPLPGAWRQARPETALLAALGVWQLTTIALTLAASARHGGDPRVVLALGRPVGAPGVYVKAIVAMVVLQIVVGIVQRNLTDDAFADLRPVRALLAGRDWLLGLAVVGVGAPLAEEMLFRGFLFSALAATRAGVAGAAVITSATWTALHAGYTLSGLGEVFLIGLFFSWLVWRTGSLRVAIFCHGLYNSLIVLALRYVPLPP